MCLLPTFVYKEKNIPLGWPRVLPRKDQGESYSKGGDGGVASFSGQSLRDHVQQGRQHSIRSHHQYLRISQKTTRDHY